MPSKDHFHSVVATLQPVIHGIGEDRLDAPTPCTEWTVRDLADHFLGTSEAMRRAGADEARDPDDPWGTAGGHLTPTWRVDLSAQLTGLADAWAREEAWQGEVDGTPKQGMGDMAYVEVMLHGWDLARGSGQDVAFDPDAVAQARAVMEQIGRMGRDGGAFGALVDVGDDASDWDVVLAEAGRDPQWRTG
ncbi:TIGR03086 family protein [Nocardioides guangzhouensis]|uniref:TIGR03086 family protein n=1 Tax=Nocardioides guangzhouensis TaxID=2497878 RepID=A0A4Q4ZDC8_9ACTN|nr:TIGR03086 family metal-binding protein [Nocardioides guangzhouensis]RYP86023.1 TIGR03086 family protein [Nocardioides guangzhouensis]